METLSAICGKLQLYNRINRLVCCISASIIFLFILLCMNLVDVYASEYDNAVDYYNKYGNNAYFKAETQNNGQIFFVTRGNKSNSGTKYKTVGWQIVVAQNYGTIIQSLYFDLNGYYLRHVDRSVEGKYEYNLYRVSLDILRARLNEQALQAINSGNCQLKFNACMVVTKGGRPCGSMNDSGIVSGNVYTTYEGIVNAQDWSDNAKESLYSYFNKNVLGLFFRVNVNKSAGIRWVTGAGTYCYGTKVIIYAMEEGGYEFSNWNNNSYYNSKQYSFYVNSDSTWTAFAKQSSLSVVLHRNQNEGDMQTTTQTFYYANSGQKIGYTGWNNPGFHMIGWDENCKSENPKYSINQEINADLIKNKSPKLDLYAIWKPNCYRFVFEGEGCEKIKDENAIYGQSIILPEAVKDTGLFKGWSFDALNKDAEYIVGQEMLVSEAALRAQVLNSDNAVIRLYAIWDQLPAIDAEDMYYPIKDIERGLITEEKIASNYKVMDYEDGEIKYGINENNRFQIIDFPAKEIKEIGKQKTQVGEFPKVEINIEAEDSVGNIVDKTVSIYFVDTTVVGKTDTFGKIRFISSKYYKDSNGNYVDEKAGGLRKNSCWYKLDDYRQIIEFALSAT